KRYPSAGELAADLRAFLDGRPVVARPVGPLGRFWRWRGRNPGLARALVVAASALVLGSVVSTGFGLWAFDSARSATDEARRADDEAGRAKDEAEKARRNAEAEREAARRAQRLLGLMSLGEGVQA